MGDRRYPQATEYAGSIPAASTKQFNEINHLDPAKCRV